jgi:mannonate dehydratase
MYLGTASQARDDYDYEVWAQLGLNHITGYPPYNWWDWTTDRLSAYREKVNSYGIELDMIRMPMTPYSIDSEVAQSGTPNIMLGKSPERDREIDLVCNILRMCSEAGIRGVQYNMNFVGILRTPETIGRGGSRNATFRWEDADKDAPPTSAGTVREDEYWERLDYFLERVIPVANECRVQMACHPHDPYTPPGYMGVDRVLGTVEGFKKYVQMHEGPYHGVTFCQGSVSEMLDDPATEIFDAIRWFGERGKLFNVHFRNIRGKKLDFYESFPDEGTVDMVKALETYRDCGYKYMIQPDHVPIVSGENPSGVAFAYTFGYIRGLMEVMGELKN